MRQKYFELKDVNEHMLKQLENGQQELDVLNSKIENLQEVRTRDQISIKRQGRHASVCNSEWISGCCLTPTQQFFSYIIWWEQINFQWDDDEVRFLLEQHA